MTENICPKCGNGVMPYSRFLREAEPYKTSTCGSCGVKLRRSSKVYLLLFVMLIVLCLIVLPLSFTLAKARMSFWIIFAAAIIAIAIWTLLTNYLSWRFIGWIPVANKEKN